MTEDRNDDGRIRHARVRIGDSIIMLNEASADYPANDSQAHLYVADVHEVFRPPRTPGGSMTRERHLKVSEDGSVAVSHP